IADVIPVPIIASVPEQPALDDEDDSAAGESQGYSVRDDGIGQVSVDATPDVRLDAPLPIDGPGADSGLQAELPGAVAVKRHQRTRRVQADGARASGTRQRTPSAAKPRRVKASVASE